MGKKVKLMWIVRKNARKASIRKKHLELAEQVSQLSKECGVKAFVIMYGQGDNEPVMWPPRRETEKLLKRFLSIPEAERYKEMTTTEAYLQEKIAGHQELLDKDNGRNRKMQMTLLLHRFHEQGQSFERFSTDELCNILSYVEERESELNKRIADVKGLVRAERNEQRQVQDQRFIASHRSTKN